eukprot:CAMPEP_0182424556 /NCGR_PEP_ID=MMETSP1167-20130531/10752_1 /TAXON_ID=2988 /ORGANISM="Mallomonas Sp, Strain CCMP3275" /LENGTH=1377 /DNA_ID=CAMNT_0024604441 /DNA_START=94 /DNA_END=4227 /DNA_ORIENTATION=+
MSSRDFKPLLYFYIRRGWHSQQLKFCENFISKKGKDPVSVFWRAYALGMTDRIQECLRELRGFEARKDMQYPVTLALLFFHQRDARVDEETVDTLNAQLQVAEEVTKEAGLLLAARFSLYIGDYDNAMRLTERVLRRGASPQTPTEMDAKGIELWTYVMRAMKGGANDRRRLSEIDHFMKSRSLEQLDVDMVMAWVRAHQVLKRRQEALGVLNQVIAIHPWYLPGLTEKAVLLASIAGISLMQSFKDDKGAHIEKEWDQSMDTAQRALDNDPDNLDALKVVTVHAFTQDYHPEGAIHKLENLERVLNMKEPTSGTIGYEYASIFARISCRHPGALQICGRMLDNAYENNPGDLQILEERAHLQIYIGNYNQATKIFRELSKKSQTPAALEGMIVCQILEGQMEDAEAQIELMLAMHSEEDLSPEFKYLQAIIALRSRRDLRRHEADLNDSKMLLERKFEQLTAGWVEPLHEIVFQNPDFMMQLAVSYLAHLESPMPASLTTGSSSGNEEQRPIEEVPPAIQSAISILQRVQRQYPGFLIPYIELSRCYSSLAKYDEATRILRSVLSMQPNCAPALVMLAKLEVSRSNTTAADRALEQAVSFDFSVRSYPLFRLVQVTIRSMQGRAEDATAAAEALMALPEVKEPGPEEGPGRMHTDSMRLTDDDRVVAFITLAAQLSKSKRLKEADKILSEAKLAFAGTPQEVQVLVASSQLAVERKEFDRAIRMLDKIKEDSPTFARSQIIKADILVNHMRDKEGFTNCYHKLVDIEPSVKNYSLLGEAYLRILNPDSAVQAFQEAYKLDKTNAKLRTKIGKAFIATHEYHSAIDFYEQARREAAASVHIGTDISAETVLLSHDLARLYLKLGRLESARRVLEGALHREQKDISDIEQDVQTLMLLSEVQALNAPSDVVATLRKARDFQKEVVNDTRATMVQTSDIVERERKRLSDICEKLGAWCLEKREGKDPNAFVDGASFLGEALQYNAQNTKAMYGLARIHHKQNEMEQCKQQCRKLLSADPSDENSAVMLSDVLFREGQVEEAVEPLQKLLKISPNNYVALERMIMLLRRIGRLPEVPAYISSAESHDKRSGSHAGLRYCKGLYARYTNDIVTAIKDFNLSRRDTTWGGEALVHMIELYLNPDQEGVWEEREGGGESVLPDGTQDHIAIADTLLRELKPIAKDPRRYKVLENYVLLATRNKASSDRAMQSFIEMLEEDTDYLPAVLGMATGFMMEKNQHKARNLLKRVGNMELTKFDGEDFEKANLLLAKFYVDKTKNDLAQDLCKRCLAQNKSCSQAWEILGLAMERDVNYEHAADCYEKAWKLEFEASASVGFKLAFSYLKCKKYVLAIDVCEKVLALYPDYPRIRDEILRKSQLALRP